MCVPFLGMFDAEELAMAVQVSVYRQAFLPALSGSTTRTTTVVCDISLYNINIPTNKTHTTSGKTYSYTTRATSSVDFVCWYMVYILECRTLGTTTTVPFLVLYLFWCVCHSLLYKTCACCLVAMAELLYV